VARDAAIVNDEALFAVVDVETTGFSPLVGDRIVEIAILRLAADGRQAMSFLRRILGSRSGSAGDACVVSYGFGLHRRAGRKPAPRRSRLMHRKLAC
jgi:hypothetical protein